MTLLVLGRRYFSRLRVSNELLGSLGSSESFSLPIQGRSALFSPPRPSFRKGRRIPLRTLSGCVGDRSLVEASESAVRDCSDLAVIPKFLSAEDGNFLLQEVQKTLRGKRYLYNHWDGAIEGYRETEKTTWGEAVQPLIQRLKKTTEEAAGEGAKTLEEVHILDLAKDGFIRPHTDSIKFCGDVIAGVSLLSQCVMVFTHQEDSGRWIRALLPPLSLYVMRGRVRYEYTHAVNPEGEESIFKGQLVTRERRVSVICRTLPSQQH